jgi:hypothetical protein
LYFRAIAGASISEDVVEGMKTADVVSMGGLLDEQTG